MPEDPPTLDAIMRRLDTVTTRLGKVVEDLHQGQVDAAQTHMCQDVWIRERALINAFPSDTRTNIAATDKKVDGASRRSTTRSRATTTSTSAIAPRTTPSAGNSACGSAP